VANRAYLDKKGIICEFYDGDQDGASVQDMIAQTLPHVEALMAKKKPVNILVDVHAMGHMSLFGRQAAGKALKEWPYRRIAVYGASTYLRQLANLLLLATRKGNKVRLFPNEAAARKWLEAS
jgi:hypothetical protein